LVEQGGAASEKSSEGEREREKRRRGIMAATVCPAPMAATSHGAFQGDNPLHFSLPLAILQICLVVVVTRGLAYVLRPLRQPRVIAEIIVSLLLLPSPPISVPPLVCSMNCLVRPLPVRYCEWPEL
jgi:hypothetical protein